MSLLDSQAVGIMKVPKVKNFTPAPVQITAEQLMREVPAYRTDDYLPLSAMGGS